MLVLATKVREPLRATLADSFSLGEFLSSNRLETAGTDDADCVFWMDLDPDGRITATVGLEFCDDQVLVRSLAVARQHRGAGRGEELARFAIDKARTAGSTRAWMMTRRTEPILQRLGFVVADIHQLEAALLATTLVREYARVGTLDFRTAWTRALT